MEDRVKGKETLCVHSPDSIFFPTFFFSPPRSYQGLPRNPIVIKYK